MQLSQGREKLEREVKKIPLLTDCTESSEKTMPINEKCVGFISLKIHIALKIKGKRGYEPQRVEQWHAALGKGAILVRSLDFSPPRFLGIWGC